MDKNVYDEPSKVAAEPGVVIVEGPDSVKVAMTPDAAAETSDRLLEGSIEARGKAARIAEAEAQQRG